MDKIDICKMTILYVTFDQNNIDTIGKHLYQQYHGHKVLYATDGIDPLLHIINSKPDISIVDMNIPPIFFSVLINELSKQNKINQTIFIDSNDNKALANYDFNYFLYTPINADSLCRMIDTIAEDLFFERITSFSN